jgi:rhamnose utilization protein RhaD (predicted bifunctional aldolase and dehydrogenase)
MVATFDYCLHGKGAAAPSIDTAMHGLVDSAHVDHLDPDSGIAIATAIDGEELTAKIFGDRVVWVPWRRPGFQLGLDIAKIKADNPQAIGCVLGGHGITAWGNPLDECEANSVEIIRTAEAYIAEHSRPEPFGALLDGYGALREYEPRMKAAALAPTFRSIASFGKPMVGHFTDDERVLEFLSGGEHLRLAELGISCPDHFLRTKVKPLVLDLSADAPAEDCIAGLRELHESYRADYQAYY